MPAGRPPLQYAHVDKLDASAKVKRRLEILLRTVHGEIQPAEAQAQLGLSESRFNALRGKMLQGAADGLLPGKSGRPRKIPAPAQAEIDRLTQELQTAQQALKIERVRAELMQVLPDRIHPPRAPQKTRRRLS